MRSKVMKYALCFFIFYFFSCVEDLDFNQADKIVLTPVYNVSLIYSKLPQTSLVTPSGVEINQISDVTKLELFTNSVADQIKKIDLSFELTNPFNRVFKLSFRFRNEMNEEVYRVPDIIINENVQKYKVKEEISLTAGDPILGATKIEVVIELLPSADGSIIDINKNKNLIFKSAGTLYFEINS